MTERWLSRGLLTIPHITLCAEEKEFTRLMKRLRVVNPGPFVAPGAHAALHTLDRGGQIAHVVCLSDWRRRPLVDVFGLLVHESVHVWQHWKEDHREDSPGSEVEAYAIQEIALKLFGEFMRRKSTRNAH